MKVTARDIFDTAKDLQRYANYANKHMCKTNITQASEKIETAKTAMLEAMNDFMETDVSTFTADTSDIERELEHAERQLGWCNDAIKGLKEENLADAKTEKKDLKKRIKILRAEITA